MRMRPAPIANVSSKSSRRPSWRRGALMLGIIAALTSIGSPVFAIPEISSRQADETDAFPPIYTAEQETVVDKLLWSEESIYYRPLRNDPASAQGEIEQVLGDNPGSDRFRRRSVRQRIRDLAKMLFPEVYAAVARPADSVGTAVARQSGRPTVQSGSTAEAILMDSVFTDFILDVVEPSVEPGGIIALTIRGLGRFALMFSRDTNSFVFVDMEKTSSFRMSEGKEFRAAVTRELSTPSGALDQQRTNPYGESTSIKSFIRKLRRLAIATVTHPGFIAFIILAIGLLVLRRLGRQDG
jgi:hypothetical protein